MGVSKFYLYKLAVAIANNIATCLAPTCAASVNEHRVLTGEKSKRDRGEEVQPGKAG